MTGVLLASAILVSGYLEAQIAAPSGLQTEQATNPPAVTDNRPDFRAVNESAVQMDRFQIQVSTDSTFTTITHWDSDPNGTFFPGSPPLLVPRNGLCPEVAYGYGVPDLLTLPLLNWNTTYFWRTRFWRLSATTDISATAQFTMAAPTRAISQHQNNGSPTAEGWRFVSVPIAFGTSVPASQLLASVPYLYRMDESTRTWAQLGPGDQLYGGLGYLAWCPPSTVLSLTTNQAKVTAGVPAVLSGTGATITPSYTLPNATFTSAFFTYTSLGAPIGQEITDGVGANGYAGNHLFGNPYNAPISWKDHTSGLAPFGHVSRTNISAMMYKWNGTQYLTYNGATNVGTAGPLIEPFQAVGILVLSTAPWQLTVNTPAPTSGGPQERIASRELGAPNPNRWYLMIEARSGAAIDTENAFGIDTDADDAWDIRDSEDPGVGTTTWLNVHFDHRSDWTTYPRKYTHDFRKTPLKKGDEVVWTFTVDGNTGLPATLTWPNLGDLSADDWKLTLEDPAGPTVVELSTTASYDTAPVNGPSTLTLRATRLKDAPVSSGSGGGGSNCGLLGLEGLLLAGWTLLRRGCKLTKTA